jgi:type I site-specific restriction endonuclease
MAKFDADPFIFLNNGKEIPFWDRERYAPRKVVGFYTRDDLERHRDAPVDGLTVPPSARYAEPWSTAALIARYLP